jgi:hypothetical protein
MDFWRMVVEHNVATMVVLSSEGEFWQYWPLDQGDKVGKPPTPLDPGSGAFLTPGFGIRDSE